MLTSAVLRMVGFCTRYPWPVIVIAAILAIGSALYTAAHFAITTDTNQLLPKDLPWRQHEQAYKDAFPQDQILVLIDGPTTELVEMAADRLAASKPLIEVLSADPSLRGAMHALTETARARLSGRPKAARVRAPPRPRIATPPRCRRVPGRDRRRGSQSRPCPPPPWRQRSRPGCAGRAGRAPRPSVSDRP